MSPKSTALLTAPCPCQSDVLYQDCCAPFHQFAQSPPTALQLMRSRYTAYVLQDIDYIVKTTVPSQQTLLNKGVLKQWAAQTQWRGLRILSTQDFSPAHRAFQQSAVCFQAFFQEGDEVKIHQEHSLFVKLAQGWYFIDPTVKLPAMKQPCVCGSGKKFKHCCGGLLCNLEQN